MSWLCTTEKALQARPAQLLEIAAEFFTNDTETDDAAQAMIDLGVVGWDGFSGEMETGFGNLVEAVGTSMRSVAVAAGTAEEACKAAGRALDDLETESDALLITAEEQQAELVALDAEAGEWSTKRYWRAQAVRAARSSQVEDPEEYDSAVRRLRDADIALYWIGAAAENKRADLTASQVTFDRIRDDEELAQTDLATALSPIYDSLSNAELKFSASDLEGVDIVLDIFDLTYLSITVDSKQDAQRRQALLDARNALAGLLGIETTERDEKIADARRDASLLAEFGLLTPDQLRELIEVALREGNAEEADRLARMLELATATMTDSERDGFLTELAVSLSVGFGDGWYRLLSLFATTDRDMPAWLASAVLSLADTYPNFFIDDPDTRAMLAAIVGLDPDDPALNDAIADHLVQMAYNSESWPDIVDAYAKGDVNVGNGDAFGELLGDWFAKNPEELMRYVRAAEEGQQDQLQALLDVVASNVDDEQLEQIIQTMIADNAPSEGLDSDHVSADWRYFINQLGVLQAAFDRIGHGDTYDFAGLVEFVVTNAASASSPGAGTAASAVYALVGGYGEDPIYQDMEDFEQLNRDNFMLAITVALHDPVLGPQVIDAIGPHLGDPDAIEEFIKTGGPVYRDVSLLADDIADARADNT